jgi:tetratricopeptide (TPR) repeat protein
MSPEQVEGKEVDARSDIYSLGIILYEMLTGQVPFEGDTPFTIGVKQKSEIPRDPKELNAQIPQDLSRLILKCLEKDKGRRYQNADELKANLEKIEQGIPTTERAVAEKKPFTSRQITVQFDIKKLLVPALAFIALVAAVLAIWRLVPRRTSAPIPTDKPAIAVMYFKNNTGDAKFDVWSTALSDSIITDLSQSKYVRVLSTDQLLSILRKLGLLEARSYASEELRRVAELGGVKHILLGSMSKAGEAFRIDYTLQDIQKGESLTSDRVEGTGENSIFSMVDELTRQVKANFNLPRGEIKGDIDKDVGEITTSSPEAYKYLSEGGRYHIYGDYHKAIRFFERAVAIDPKMALAYLGMAKAYNNLGYFSETRKSLQKAFELSDRLPDKERYYIQAEFYRGSEKTYDKAIEAYNKLLQLYPNELLVNINLVVIYMQLEEWDKGLERLALLRQNKDENWQTYFNLASIYMAQGSYEKARAVLENYLNDFSDKDIIRYLLASNYLCQRKYDLALVEVDKAASHDSVFFMNFCWMKGDIYHCQGDLIKAEKEYQKLLDLEEQTSYLYGRNRLGALYLLQGKFKESEDQLKKGIELAEKIGDKGWESDFHLKLAYVYLKSGNPTKVLEECNDARSRAVEIENLSDQRQVSNYKGLACLEINSIEEAKKEVLELRELNQTGIHKKAIRYYHHLVGMMELKKDNVSKAIEYFKEAISLLPSQCDPDDMHAFFIDSLASAYYKSGDLEKALKEYERITTLTTGRLFFGDIYAKSFYMLGKIAEQEGDKGRAIENYRKFLDLWKDADPGTPEVEDARKRLAALKD